MKEYIILSIIAIFAVYIVDTFLLRTCLFRRKLFWKFQVIVAVLTTLVDNYSSGRPIVYFNDQYITGLRVINVPIENYLFGFALLSLNVILYEYFLKNKPLD